MSDLFILALLALGQIIAVTVAFVIWRVATRLTMACRLCFDRGLSYTWSRTWRKAGYFLQH